MNKTHFYTFLAGIVLACLLTDASFESSVEVLSLIVGFWLFALIVDWLNDNYYKMKRGTHKLLCKIKVHDWGQFSDGECAWCQKKRGE